MCWGGGGGGLAWPTHTKAVHSYRAEGATAPPENLTKVMITSEHTLHVYSKMLIVRKILNNAHCHVTDQLRVQLSDLHVETMETSYDAHS